MLHILTPENAEVKSDIDSFLVLNSQQSLTDLIVFYENIFRELDIRETEIDDTREGVWIFSGVYHGIHNETRAHGYEGGLDNRERPFIVELRDSGQNSVDIEVIY